MDDAWELTYLGTLTRDGTGDFDGDGMSDLNEFLAGTSPTEASDRLVILSSQYGSPTTLEFRAAAGRTYTVQYRDSLDDRAWLSLTSLPAQAGSGPVTVTDLAPGDSTRF